MEARAPGSDRRVTLKVRTADSRTAHRLCLASRFSVPCETLTPLVEWLFELRGLWFAAKSFLTEAGSQPIENPDSGDLGQFWFQLPQKPVRPASMPHFLHLYSAEVDETQSRTASIPKVPSIRHCMCSLPWILRSTVALVFVLFPSPLLWKTGDTVFAKPPFLLDAGKDFVSTLPVHIKMGSQSHMPANLGTQLHWVERSSKLRYDKRKFNIQVCPNFLQPCLVLFITFML